MDATVMNQTESESIPNEAESNGLPKIGNAFSLSAAMMNNVSKIVMTTAPLGKSNAEEANFQPPNANDMDVEAENETYEVLDVIDNESDAEANSTIETEKQIAPKNDFGSSLRIKRVFQGVTEHLLGDITTKRKEKVRATKLMRGQPPNKMAKKSTSNVTKIRAMPVPKAANQIRGTTYSGPRVTSHSIESAKTVQSVEKICGDAPDDDLIELIEIPEKMQMELDTALNTFKEDSVDSDEDNSVSERSAANPKCRDYRCNVCLEQNTSFSQLKKHLFSAHLLAYVCRECHGTFDWNSEYAIHVQRGDCKEKLNAHRKFITLIDPPIRLSGITAHGNKREQTLLCGNCRLTFANISQYCAHAQYHAKTFLCQICAKEDYRSQSAMARHLIKGVHRAGKDQRCRQVFDKNSLYMSKELSAIYNKTVMHRL